MYTETIHFTPCLGCRLVGEEVEAADGSTLELTKNGGLRHRGTVEITFGDGDTRETPYSGYITSGQIEQNYPDLATAIKGCGRIGLLKHCPARQLLESCNAEEQFPWPNAQITDENAAQTR